MAEAQSTEKGEGEWEQAVKSMKNGRNFRKVRSKLYRRSYKLDADLNNITYKSFRKRPSDPRTHLPILEISEIRRGLATDNFNNKAIDVARKAKPGPPEDVCFSLIFKRDRKPLDLIADCKETREIWITGIRGIQKKLASETLTQKKERFMKELFENADANKNQELNVKEVTKLLKKMNLKLDEHSVERVVKSNGIAANTLSGGENALNYNHFKTLYQAMTGRPEIESLFMKHNIAGKYLDADELQHFMKAELGENFTTEQCRELIQKYEPVAEVKEQGEMGVDGMFALVNSELMDIFDASCRTVYQDMSLPLSDYFVDSSHNTYLAGNQLTESSKVECYIQALLSGCRCVEMDCWDGDAEHDWEPVVYHGHTLTSKLKFSDIVAAINEYSFKTSDYPVILSFENHCSEEYQHKIAEHLKSIVKDKLYLGPLPAGSTQLPSPASLRGLIVVKAKPRSNVDEEDDDEEKEEEKSKKALTEVLSDLVVICKGAKFKGFLTSVDSENFINISSIAENKAKGFVENHAVEWIRHNRVQLSRIYPKGLRFWSSNYEPLPMWGCGNHVVALNYQTPDEDMHHYKGFFMDNGGCGYVLKPEYMRKGEPFSPAGPFPAAWKKRFTIRIISGFRLPKDSDTLDPYVVVRVDGLGQEKQVQKTKRIKNNGFHPVWENPSSGSLEEFTFDVTVPDLTLILIYVKDDDTGTDPPVAQYCLPFKCMKQGYRIVHLKDVKGKMIEGAQLFVHVTIH